MSILSLDRFRTLEELEHFFEDILNSESKPKVFGLIDFDEEDYTCITKIIRECIFEVEEFSTGSLAISTFLVWTGILKYNGNFWAHVYEVLNIPFEEIAVQRKLGEIFLSTLRQHDMMFFTGGLRYVTPVLAHGCVANVYIDDYFNFIYNLYKKELSGDDLSFANVQPIVEQWRRESQNLMARNTLEELIEREAKLTRTLELFPLYETLGKLTELRKALSQSQLVDELIANLNDYIKKKKDFDDLFSKINEILEIFSKKSELCMKIEQLDLEILKRLLIMEEYIKDNTQATNLKFVRMSTSSKSIIDLVNINNQIANEVLKNLREELSKKRAESLSDFEEKLKNVYPGEIIEGLQFLEKQKELRKKINDLEQERLQRYSHQDLHDMTNCLPVIFNYEMNMQLIKEELQSIQNEIANHELINIRTNNLLSLLPEPVRIFILQGREVAERFIYESLNLLKRIVRSERIEDINLPSRLKTRIKESLEQKLSLAMTNTVRYIVRTTRNFNRYQEDENLYEESDKPHSRFRKPTMRLDPTGKSIQVILPEQVICDCDKLGTWEFKIKGDNIILGTKQLRYRRAGDMYRTKAIIEHLAKPCENYEFLIEDMDSHIEIKKWVLKLNRDYMLFSPEMKLIIGDEIPEKYDTIYLVTKAGCKVIPDIVIEREQLIAGWNDYEYTCLNLRDVESIILEKDGKTFGRLERMINTEPQLHGVKIVEWISLDGKQIYSTFSPSFVFSIRKDEDIRLYYINLVDETGQVISKPVKELIGQGFAGRTIEIPLSLLTKQMYGSFRLSLIKDMVPIWNQEFVLVPNLTVSLERYFSNNNESDSEILLKSDIPFKVTDIDKNVQLEGSDLVKILRTDRQRENVNLTVEFYNSIDRAKMIYETTFNLNVPRINWKFSEDEEWTTTPKEVWFDDLRSFQVKLPSYLLKTKPFLYLGSTDFYITGKRIGDDVVKFNLQEMTDILYELHSQEKVTTTGLYLGFKDENKNIIGQVLVANIRLLWEVKSFLIEISTDNPPVLHIQWKDLGKATDRVLSIRKLNKEFPEWRWKIKDGEYALNFENYLEQIEPGKYVFQFEIEDPWRDSGMEPSIRSSFIVQLVNPKKIIEEVVKGIKRIRILDIEGVESESEELPTNAQYWIQDIEPLVEDSLTGRRFRGRLCSQQRKDILDNSFWNFTVNWNSLLNGKFRITEIEDSQGDGIMYCKKCKSLFSDHREHEKCNKEGYVILPDGLLITLREEEHAQA
ncbi:hypothetical protein [Fervidobacterium nodosum]|uniref:Uncharacterized protein n=1 Tax=Fervidobacterium nodosum (strain ATCC 35602 / DSM 5306 / Rt17-B1) TaxID=381764 RepID=A7HMW8_FERNB|nr:hypothetical protein [Fervidobacterium nodosum]ABS61251.1 hypothetical protein Fnod_1405 [Fervidobacterium nodosum Rt17-B1]